MSKVRGRARVITGDDVHSYTRMIPNPIGVTTLASVNGRGSASLRALAYRQTAAGRKQRAMRAVRYLENAKHSTRGPGGKFVKASTTSSSGDKMSDTESPVYHKVQYSETSNRNQHVGRPKAKRPKARYRTVTVKHRQRVSVGNKIRASVYDPLSGRTRLSWAYVAKNSKGKRVLRKIPRKAVEGSSKRYSAEYIDGLREKAAARILKHGGLFVPNRKKKAKKVAAKRRRKPVAVRRLSGGPFVVGRRAVGYSTRRVKSRLKARKATAKTAGKKKTKAQLHAERLKNLAKARRALKAKAAGKKTTRKPAKRKTATRKAATRKAATRKAAPRKTTRKTTRRSRKQTPAFNTGRGTHSITHAASSNVASHRTSPMTPNGRRRRSSRRGSRRHYTMNAFMSDFTSMLKVGAIVTGGFLVHRVVANLIAEQIEKGYTAKMTDAKSQVTMRQWQKPLVGLGVMALGLPASYYLVPQARMEIGAGMVASFVQQLLIAGLAVAAKDATPDSGILKAAAAISGFDGYEDGVAYSLHGDSSIMPHYTSVGEYFSPMNGLGEYFAPMNGLGSFNQAAAGVGSYNQAAAGVGSYNQAAAGMGAYLQAAAGTHGATGEYFAPAGLEGVGDYENAGELALLPGRAPTVLEDGIRPDGDLDKVLDLAEAAAGVRGMSGLGEYITASRGKVGWDESVVPQQSQWVPNGPMWAGTLNVEGNIESSEVPAGILATQGGNGILST
jgi:hypothetical protein